MGGGNAGAVGGGDGEGDGGEELKEQGEEEMDEETEEEMQEKDVGHQPQRPGTMAGNVCVCATLCPDFVVGRKLHNLADFTFKSPAA